MSAVSGSEMIGAQTQPVQENTDSAPVLSVSRIGVLILFLLAVANGVFLYFLPWLAETSYAWPIKPPINAATMGAGYLAGAVVTGLSLLMARYWRSIRGFIWGFFTLGGTLFVATIIHADRFFWSYPLTWVWTGVYMLIPPLALAIWFIQERAAGKVPALTTDARLGTIKTVSLVLGAVLALGAAVLYVAPDVYLQIWPWQITPLLARVFAGWYLLAAVILLYGGMSAREAREVPIPYITLTVWSVLLLLLPLIYSSSLRAGSWTLWVWVALHLALALFTAWAAYFCYGILKKEGKRL